MHDEQNLLNYRQLYGPCSILVPIPTFFDFLMMEMIKPFTFMTYMGIIIWWIEGFFSSSLSLTACTLLFWCINYSFVKQGLCKISEMTKMDKYIQVFRIEKQEVKLLTVEVASIVPGDMVVLTQDAQIPADCLLVQGELNIEEAMLTGEVKF